MPIDKNKELKKKPNTKPSAEKKQVENFEKGLSLFLRNNPSANSKFRQAVSAYSGPLPQADEFQKYENALPGAADRILKIHENNQEHAIKNSRKSLEAGIQLARRVNWMTFVITGIIVLGSLAYLIFGGENKRIVAISAPSVIGIFLILKLIFDFAKNRRSDKI